MKKVFIKIKPFIKYLFIFFFFLYWSLIVQPISLDEIWNYGFSYNIYNSLIPYKDFNMVMTPIYPMIMSIFLMINSSILTMHIVNSLMLTGMIYLIEKLINKKYNISIFLILLIFPMSLIFPSYNIFLLMLLILIIYLEKNNSNDYLIGFILGFLILTKQSVGVFVALVSLYYLYKDKSKVIRRIIGCFIPCFCFLIYLIISNSFSSFLDLCLFGLFDFGKSNSNFNYLFIFGICLLILNILLIKNSKDKLNYYYLLSFFSIMIPLFDLYHVLIYFFSFIFIYLLEEDISFKCKYLNIELFIFGLLIGIVFVGSFYRFNDKVYFPNNINHFEYRMVNDKYLDYSDTINGRFLEYRELGYKVIFLSADGYYFKLINDIDIDYLDLINSGNWGYNGSSKLLNKIKSCKNCVFFLDENEIGLNKQTDQKLLKYVIDNGCIKEEFGNYKVYMLGDTCGED
mgnify:CR=1 FL=1